MNSELDHFLNMLKHRASTQLYMQLYEGVNGDPGDREMTKKTGMRYAHVSPLGEGRVQ